MKKTIEDVTIICPYIFANEITVLKDFLGWELNTLFEEDPFKIGSDLMYQKLWNRCNPHDIFIMHADMLPKTKGWLSEVLEYVNKYPKTGIFGCKLIYPVEDENKKSIIQSAGGCFEENIPQHFGSGLDLFTNQRHKEIIEIDNGQFDKVREVAWSTFGGIYIRREVLNEVGDFDPSYEWSYNRDVDYCLEARKAGWKIYQIPVTITHFESKDNKRLRADNPELNEKESRNLTRLQKKWGDSPLYETINIEVE